MKTILRHMMLVMAVAALLIAPSARAQQAEVTIEREGFQFGLGGAWRQGSFAPIRINVSYFGNKPVQPALIVWEQRDGDGDIAEFSQPITLNPGRNPVRLYLPVRYEEDATTMWDVIVYDYEYDRRGSQLAAQRFVAGTPIDPNTSVIGIVGMRHANLADYAVRLPQGNRPPTSHEFTNVLNNLQPDILPTRWMGYSMLEHLVWTQGEPGQLTMDQAEALMEWVQRGGHLVIVLPQVGQSWRGTRLDPILPAARVQRLEGQTLRDRSSIGGLLRHLSREDRVAPDRESRYPIFNLHVFMPVGESWADDTTIPLMEIEGPGLRSGRAGSAERVAVAVQRPVGFGRVTMVGVPVSDVVLNRAGLELPDADVFWNQILGRRQDTPRSPELDPLLRQQASALARAGQERAPLSRAIVPHILLTRDASTGLLLALVLFVVYWAVSGPAVFAVLKARGLSRYNWLAFVGIAAVFTAISWVGAAALRTAETPPRHLTILDHVADVPYQRSTSFLTLALDGYGNRLLGVAAPEDWPHRPVPRNVIASLSDPRQMREGMRFPDVRRYRLESGHQASMNAPARSTSKSLYVSALHPVEREWIMPNFDRDEERPRVDGAGRLHGVLRHHLPGPLERLTIYYVSNEYAFRPRPPGGQRGLPRLRTYAWKKTGDTWLPGERLDLSAFAPTATDLVHHSQQGYFTVLGAEVAAPFRGLADPAFFRIEHTVRFLEALSFFHQLNPPDWAAVMQTDHPRFERTLGREIDMSPWMARPCVIITGVVRGSPIPYPLTIDGSRVAQADRESITFVRWIYPLPVEHEARPAGE